MIASEEKRNEVLGRLQVVRNRLINLLCQSVKREVRIDPNGLGNNIERQAELKNAINGLSILYYYSFLQYNVSKEQWNRIKNSSSDYRESFNEFDWRLFDAFKYIRDCFGHDYEGTLFPSTQNNTVQFMAVTEVLADQRAWEIMNSKIVLHDSAVGKAHLIVKKILESADIAI